MKVIIKNKVWLLLFLIVLISALLRLWDLGKVPASLDWDEAALGYNAYSILHTGRDEYGKFFPTILQSFNDYKPALYTYITIPSIAIFDLTIFSVRLPSALFGILTVFAVFFLVKGLFTNSESGIRNQESEITTIALLSSFFLAISPWHIQFSRVAFETNVGLALNVFTALFFLKGLKKTWYLIPSIVCADLALYVYQSEKVFTPLLFLALVIIYRKQLFTLPKKPFFTAILLGIIIALPMLYSLVINKNTLARAQGVSIFAQSSTYLDRNTTYRLFDIQQHDKLGLVFDSHWVIWAREALGDYLVHFSPNWLFIAGDIDRHHAPNMGLLYLCELPLILIGIYQLVFGKFDKKTKLLIGAWYLIAPIPSAISIGAPHAVRTLNFLPTYQIFTALGVYWLLQLKIRKNIKYGIFTIAICAFIFNFAYYLDQYFVQLNYYDAADWQYGYQQAIAEVNTLAPSYQHIVVSSQSPLDQSYIFFLFYLKYPPQQYQIENSQKPSDADHAFSKYIFRPIHWSSEVKRQDILYVGSEADFPKGIQTIQTIRYPNGKNAILIVKG